MRIRSDLCYCRQCAAILASESHSIYEHGLCMHAAFADFFEYHIEWDGDTDGRYHRDVFEASLVTTRNLL